ncbi:hypothetical protein Pan97_14490 [Bremerella volcania]|uniref:Uncharacterized protein n=1 Tax=Bremerella volcania TaxID=2527984 RepID=A0A518C5E6_9BACT|nr:hypothetical protein Pan97_14490 [Bremerella volcania]
MLLSLQSLQNWQQVFQAKQMISVKLSQFSFLERRFNEKASHAHVTNEVCGSIQLNQSGIDGTRLRGNLGYDGIGHRDDTGTGNVWRDRIDSYRGDRSYVSVRGDRMADRKCCSPHCGRIGAAANQCGVGSDGTRRRTRRLQGSQNRLTRGIGRRRYSSPGISESLTRDWIT